MRIQLSDHFTFGRLLRFTLPSVCTMIFTSVYSIVDGLFVSNFAGKTPFAAINLIYPVLMLLGAVGFMLGTGGAAIVGKDLGEGERDKANSHFSLFVISAAVGGMLLSTGGQIFIKPLAAALGATGQMFSDCVLYGRLLLIALPFFMLQYLFQIFFVTCEKPRLGLAVTVIAGVTNIVLDALLVAVMGYGLVGAAVATVIAQVFGGLFPAFYFARKNDSLLRLTMPDFDGRALLKACSNGCSELMSNIAASVVTILYNYQLMRLVGENGVAAYGVIMYVAFIFSGIFMGYSIGSAPIVSYNYGADNKPELKNIFKKSLLILCVTGVVLFGASEALSGPLTRAFVGYDRELFLLTVQGLRIYAIAFLIMGFSIYGSAFFTALNNGIISAAISFLRTLVFEVGSVLILPVFFGITGVWFSVVVAESVAVTVTAAFLLAKRKKYGYF